MEIILLQDIARLGSKDDVITVKDGYARNCLIPQKKAIIANKSTLKALEENKRQRAFKEAKLKDEALVIAEKLKDKNITIGAKTSSTGKIFGSINEVIISEKISESGIEINRKQVIIPETIKEIGAHTVKVKLHKDIIVDLNLDIVSE
ncbi:MAG: 50S ribosomal protein L9 [Bacteroidales bacterium]